MATGISEVIDLIHPTASGTGVILSDTAWIVFDREIDQTSVEDGNFFLTGPDFDQVTGPDLQIYQDLASSGSGEDDFLESPGFEGLVAGSFSFERISLTTNDVVSTTDVVGSGHLFRTKATFTPTNRFQADTEYSVHVSGDEYTLDTLLTGISSRTVFDPVASGTNTGTGDIIAVGGYIGNNTDTYHVAITTAGAVGTSKFTFYRDSDLLSVFGPFRTKEAGVLLSDGVSVEFEEGQYDVGDSWHFVCQPREVFSGNLIWTFKTGSGSIASIPDSTSTTVIGDIGTTATTSSSSATTFSVSSTSPVDNATNQVIVPGEYTITVNFNSDIDALTVVSGVDVIVRADPVTGELASDTGSGAVGVTIARPVVSGSELQIIVASGQLAQNNLVTITLDSSIASTGGTSLGSDYSFSFTTRYSPLYCTSRKLRLSIGQYIKDLPDDTLNFAIHMASLAADQLNWNTSIDDNDYFNFVRGQWVCCKAEEILLINVAGGSGQLKSKKLGDLSVEYNTSSNTNAALERAIACQQKFEGALIAGGQQVQKAALTIRGSLDPDRPPIGRGWYHSRNLSMPQVPAANKKTRFYGTRRYRNTYDRVGSGKGWWSR